jgi:hypothetical protein
VGEAGLSRDIIRNVARPGITVRKYKMGEEPLIDEDVLRMTPGERMALQWEITKALWMWQSGSDDEPPFRRDVVRVIRRGR